jgi:biotin carboxyl carrier protein
MSLYFVTIGKNQYHVNLEGNRLHVNGKPVAADLKAVNELGVHVLKRGKNSIELYLKSVDADNMEILVGGQRVLARVETSQRKAQNRTNNVEAGAICAPMPGTLVSVLVKPEDQVQQGQTLAVLESMKMQMQLRAAVSGTVAGVFYAAGDQVEKGKEIIRVK